LISDIDYEAKTSRYTYDYIIQPKLHLYDWWSTIFAKPFHMMKSCNGITLVPIKYLHSNIINLRCLVSCLKKFPKHVMLSRTFIPSPQMAQLPPKPTSADPCHLHHIDQRKLETEAFTLTQICQFIYLTKLVPGWICGISSFHMRSLTEVSSIIFFKDPDRWVEC
jgi:hypothetical protein